jgi:hypothetical protein
VRRQKEIQIRKATTPTNCTDGEHAIIGRLRELAQVRVRLVGAVSGKTCRGKHLGTILGNGIERR